MILSYLHANFTDETKQRNSPVALAKETITFASVRTAIAKIPDVLPKLHVRSPAAQFQRIVLLKGR